MQMLESPRRIVEVLGGVPVVQRLTRAKHRQAVDEWLRLKRFPANRYHIMTEALAELGFEAPPRFWGQIEKP